MREFLQVLFFSLFVSLRFSLKVSQEKLKKNLSAEVTSPLSGMVAN